MKPALFDTHLVTPLSQMPARRALAEIAINASVTPQFRTIRARTGFFCFVHSGVSRFYYQIYRL